jgi:hypothetical protein
VAKAMAVTIRVISHLLLFIKILVRICGRNNVPRRCCDMWM